MIDERSPDLGEWDAGPRELDSDGQWDYWARAEGGAGPGCLDGTVQCTVCCRVIQFWHGYALIFTILQNI